METSIQNYFWLVDRLGMEDDPRNRVNAENETVTLSEQLQSGIQDGQIFSKLLVVMHRTFTMRTSANFELSTQPLVGPREANWDQLIPQLLHYGVNVNDAKAERLKIGDSTQLKHLLTTLFEIDTSPVPQQHIPVSASQGKILPKLEHVGKQAKEEIESDQKQTPQRRNSTIVLDPIQEPFSRQMAMESKNTADAANQPSARNQFEQDILAQAAQSMSPQAVNKKEKGLPQKKRDARTVRQSLKSGLTRGSTKDIELPESLDETLTSAQFIMKSLMLAFEMNSNQIAGLLSDNHRYLYHLCIKGLKGGEFDKVQLWYQLISENAPHLVSLLEMETQNQAESKKPPLTVGRKSVASKTPPAPAIRTLMKTLNILKGGFYSKDQDVVVGCITLFQVVISELNLCGGDIVGQTWDWFTQQTEVAEGQGPNVRASQNSLGLGNSKRRASQLPQQPSQKGSSPTQQKKLSVSKGKGAKKIKSEEPIETNEFIESLKQSGIEGLVHAMKTNDGAKEAGSFLLLHFGKFNAVELFTEKLLQLLGSWSDYALFCLNIFNATYQSELGVETLEMTGVFSFWVLQSLKVAESSGEVTLDDRISSLVLLAEIWMNHTAYVDNTVAGSGQVTLNILKRAARDVKQTLAIVAIELMFRLLDQFAMKKHTVAPMLYKTLTFILVEFYWEIEIRDLMLHHFIYLFKKHQNIPVAILSEPLLKQVQISQYHATSFNVIDFQFFQVVAYHKKLNVQTSLLLLDSLTKIALASVFYAKVSLQTMRSIIMRFSKQPDMLAYWKESFRQMLVSLVNMETTLTQHDLAAKEDKNNFYVRMATQTRGRRQTKKIHGRQVSGDFRLTEAEAIAVKTNQRLIVNVLDKIIALGNDLLNEELRQQLIDCFMAVQAQLEIRSKPLTYLLGKYGVNVDAMISHKLNVPDAPESADSHAILVEESPSPTRGRKQIINITLEDKMNNELSEQKIHKSRSVSKSPNHQIDPSRALVGPRESLQIKRKVETATSQLSPKNKASNQAKRFPRKFKNKQSANTQNSIARAPRSISNAANMQPLQLYDYHDGYESATNLLRYRHFVKRHLKLYKEIFARYEGNSTRTSRVPKSLLTFDAQKKNNQVISGPNLIKFIKEFELMPAQGNFITTLRIRQDIPQLIKLINQLPDCGLETKQAELNIDGFVEFLVQYAHQLWNVGPLSVDKPLLAIELSEKLLQQIKQVNESKRLMLKIKNLNGTDNLDPEQQDMLILLNEKIAENPDYPLPDGYKKTQELVIEDSYQIPDVLNINESEKICMELLDDIFEQALGLHILKSVPVTRTVTRVTLDQQKIMLDLGQSMNQRSQSQGSSVQDLGALGESRRNIQFQPNIKVPKSRISQRSRGSRSQTKSPNKFQSANMIKTPQILANKGKQLKLESSLTRQQSNTLRQSFKSNTSQQRLRPELKLAVMQTTEEDRPLVAEVAQTLEEMLLAVETEQLVGFSLVDNEIKLQGLTSNLLETASQIKGNAKLKNRLRGTTASVDNLHQRSEDNEAGSGARYLSKYVSKRTQLRQKEIEEEKAIKTKPISPGERKKRASRIKDSIDRQTAYMEQQKKELKDKTEQKQKELEKTQLTKARALKYKKEQTEKVKQQLKEFNEKKEQEKLDTKAKEVEEKKAKNKVANVILKKKGAEVEEELKQLHQNVKKQQTERQLSLERQKTLPKRPIIDYASKVKPSTDAAGENEEDKNSKKPPMPKTVRSVSKKASEINAIVSPRTKAAAAKPVRKPVSKNDLKPKPSGNNADIAQIQQDSGESKPATGEERLSAMNIVAEEIKEDIPKSAEAQPVLTEVVPTSAAERYKPVVTDGSAPAMPTDGYSDAFD